jgi:hypothetical protein
MKVRVVKQEADEEKGTFKATMKGSAGDLLDGALVDVEVRLTGKIEQLLEAYPRKACFVVRIDREPKA